MPEYVIRIEDKTSQTSAAPVASQSVQNEQPGQQKQSKQASAGDYIVSRAIVPMAKSVSSFAVASVGISTGSQELQQRTDFAVSMANTVLGAASTVIGAMSVIGGPVGTAVGVGVAAISVATQYGIKYAQMQQQMRLEEEQLSLYRSRMGAGFNQSRNGGAR